MSYFQKLQEEIAAKVAGLDNTGAALRPEWITHAVCNDHAAGLADNDDAEFWRQGGYRTVRLETGRYLRKVYDTDAGTEEAKQQTLPGYDHVQRHYIVTRDDDEMAVSPYDMTDAEIVSKVATLRKSGEATLAHADELERFGLLRKAQTA